MCASLCVSLCANSSVAPDKLEHVDRKCTKAQTTLACFPIMFVGRQFHLAFISLPNAVDANTTAEIPIVIFSILDFFHKK